MDSKRVFSILYYVSVFVCLFDCLFYCVSLHPYVHSVCVFTFFTWVLLLEIKATTAIMMMKTLA